MFTVVTLPSLQCWYSVDDGPLFEGLNKIIKHYSSQSDGLPVVLSKCIPRRDRRYVGLPDILSYGARDILCTVYMLNMDT